MSWRTASLATAQWHNCDAIAYIVLLVLEVRVCVHANPVDVLNDLAVGAVGPRVPGVNVTNGRIRQRSAGDCLAHLLDVVDQHIGVDARVAVVLLPRHRVTVEILTTDGQTDDQICEVASILVDRALECRELVLEFLLVLRCPDTKKHSSLGVDRSLERRDRGGLSAALDVGVQSDRVPPRCARQVGALLELSGEIVVGLGGLVGPEVAGVETLGQSLRGRDAGREGCELREEHREGCAVD